MFPMEFDHRILGTLPFPTDEQTRRITELLRAIIGRRIVPHFKTRKGTDPIVLARCQERLSINRLEDEANRNRLVTLLTRSGDGWVLHLHERIFDYLAFVIPSDPESRLGDGTLDERKMLAFAELLLRHQMEHILYPDHTERDVISADVDFAMEQRRADPTFYRMLRSALADEMNGIRGELYLALMDHAEQERPYHEVVSRVLEGATTALADLSGRELHEVFPVLDVDLKSRLLGELYRRSQNNTLPLMQRASCFQDILQLFTLQMETNAAGAMEVFQAFKERWGVVTLFHELRLPEGRLDNKNAAELFELFKEGVLSFMAQERAWFSAQAAAVGPPGKPTVPSAPAEKTLTLKDRIEAAHSDPRFPPQVLEVIDRNKLNAVGHSGAKYSELIETLLAIPWGKIQPVRVSPTAFEEGLHRTHYGLQKPKELLCDFFSNLIWRYRQYSEAEAASWHRTGSAFLFVGPPGVGKTSLAISIAQNLEIPYHKISLGGMQDEADIRGHGFTYEGSKPGAVVQGLIKMGVMNGMIIMDEADKTEKFAIATLLEILDPEQNHLYHDKYTETTVDIDLSNCHFILTANTLETVPPTVINRCEVVFLDRYSVEEKIAIARKYLIERLRTKYQIGRDEIFFDPDEESDLLRHLIRTYTYEAGVRELERIIRTLFLRIQRKEILTRGATSVCITRVKIKQYLEEPRRPRQINNEDRVGEMLALGVDIERGVGSIIPIQATRIRLPAGGEPDGRGAMSIVHATGNIEKIMDESRKVAATALLHCADAWGIDLDHLKDPVHLHFMGASTSKDGPSAGGAIALALASQILDRKIRRDVAMTGEIDTQGRISSIGALVIKLETACDVGCKTMIIPRENLHGPEGIERLPDALKEELQILTYEDWQGDHPPFDHTRHILQVVAVDHIVQAASVVFIEEQELVALEGRFIANAREVAQELLKRRSQPGQWFQLLQIKTPGELAPELLQSTVSLSCNGWILLTLPEAREKILHLLDQACCRMEVREFDPLGENLSTVLLELREKIPECPSSPLHLSLVAPFYLLKRDGISSEAFPSGSAFAGLTLFANNYSLQQLKIKSSKAILNRVYCHLAQLDPVSLSRIPFLARQDGIHVVDLSLIPEKYRLDVQRAEEILHRCLTRWLSTLEELMCSSL
ncbi:S16 family serine protease [Desulforhabdus sp. TSK]|uniref:S16 family serine protease n=1 Tax=Desulforhabdus sp. TSK TaxID=2925014 RepID=UPI001FC7F46F|nr:S16 family serine protease [Desulforhabdus sp. TSK]GKT08755.1 hypothetical protein DSTSK_20600 [Desulforhabdus sp. TSK]